MFLPDSDPDQQFDPHKIADPNPHDGLCSGPDSHKKYCGSETLPRKRVNCLAKSFGSGDAGRNAGPSTAPDCAGNKGVL